MYKNWKEFKIAALLFMSLTLIIFGSMPTAFAATNLTAESGVNANRIWTVRFNQSVDSSTLSANITVVPSGSTTPALVLIEGGSDSQTAVIYPPAGGYTAGQSYIITVGSGVKSGSGANCQLATKTFTVSSATASNSTSYTQDQLEAAGITCTNNDSVLTMFTNDYTGIFTIGQTTATINNSPVTLATADVPVSSGGSSSVTANLLWQCFGISMGSNNQLQESLKVETAGTHAYAKTGTTSILINSNDRLLPSADTEICNGSTAMTLSMNDGTRFILDPQAKIKLATSTRNADGSKTFLLELVSGNLTVAAIKPTTTDSVRIKTGNESYFTIDDTMENNSTFILRK